jgi:hypothetical protein
MRKLEGLVKEILVELNYLKNGKGDSPALIVHPLPLPHSHTPHAHASPWPVSTNQRMHNLIMCAMCMSAGDHNHYSTEFTLRVD